MAFINITNQTTPATPASGTERIYIDSADKLLKTIDDTGTIRTNTGDVNGPASAVADNFTSFNGTTGKLVKDSGVSSASYTSIDNFITSAGSLVMAHGLGARPTEVAFFLVNQLAEHGYSLGDVIIANIETDDGQDTGLTAVLDATNISVRFGARATVFKSLNFTTGARVNLTNTSWKIRTVAKVW